jgi:hypothetical protein
MAVGRSLASKSKKKKKKEFHTNIFSWTHLF